MSRTGVHILGPDEVGLEGANIDRSRPASVLLVEDDAAILDSLGEALRGEGLDVVTAENGRDALELLRNGLQPSAIILDLMMPVMDGWDFRHAQLRDPTLKDIPVIVITATGFSANTIRRQFGGVDLVPKPVPYAQLLALVGRAGSARSGAA